jgi:hypothetical protein
VVTGALLKAGWIPIGVQERGQAVTPVQAMTQF